MKLSSEQLEAFSRDGLLILPGLFSADEVAAIRAVLPPLFDEACEANIREKAGTVPRTVMGLHQRSDLFDRLVRHPRLVEPARQIAGDDLYIQQVKVNVKAAFEGDVWQWHYDFATHHRDDGVPAPQALNLHILLDDVNHYNGPLYFIPGSHRHEPLPTFHDVTSTSYPLWVVDRETVTDLIAEGGITPALGPPRHGAHLRRPDGSRFAGQHVALGPRHLLPHPQPGRQRPDRVRAARAQAPHRLLAGRAARRRLPA